MKRMPPMNEAETQGSEVVGSTDTTTRVGFYLHFKVVVKGAEQEFLVQPSPVKGSYRVGSGFSCHIVINDELVSNSHFQILWDKEKGQFMIADFGSKNGTFISGKKIPRDWIELLPYQVVFFGRNNRMFVHENPSPTFELMEPRKPEQRKIPRRKK